MPGVFVNNADRIIFVAVHVHGYIDMQQISFALSNHRFNDT